MKKIIYIALLPLFVASCILTPMDERGACEGGEEGKYLSFVLAGSSENMQGGDTRATPAPYTRAGVVDADDDYNENKVDFNGDDVKDLHIFFFNTNRTTCIFYPEADRLGLVQDVEGEKIIKIKLDPDTDAGDTFPVFGEDKIIGKQTVMYVVANSRLSRSDFMSNVNDVTTVYPLSQIMNIVLDSTEDGSDVLGVNKTIVGAEGLEIVKQEKFVMDAYQDVFVAGWTNVATITLKRVMSKIQMGIYSVGVSGYTATTAEVQLVNYVNNGYLGKRPSDAQTYPSPVKYGTSDFIPVPIPESTSEYAEPFYSYPSDWSADMSKQAYLLLKVNLYVTGENESTAVPYYYKVPLSYIPSDAEGGAEFRNKLKRNFIYRYYVRVNTVGSLTPEQAVELDANVDIVGWSGEDVATNIQKFDWLFVEEQNIVIYPVAGETIQIYDIPYRSNTDIKFTVGDPMTTQYEDYTNGVFSMKNYASGSNQIPTINLEYYKPGDNSQRYIRIQSRTPVNYVPKHIYLKVENEATLYATVNIVHYPAVYITAVKHTGQSVLHIPLRLWLLPVMRDSVRLIITAITGFQNIIK